MKKLLSLMLSLMLILGCVPALAASEGYADYTHPTQGYSLEYPQSWLALDSANIESLMIDLSANPALATLNLDAVLPQITQMQMTMFVDINGSNINVVRQSVGMAITAEQFMPMMPQMLSQVTAALPGAQVLEEGALYTIGDHQYCNLCISYNLAGSDLYAFQFYTFSGTDMYLITLTMNPASDMDAVAEYTDHLLATLEFPAN